jgi:hypothetical protein
VTEDKRRQEKAILSDSRKAALNVRRKHRSIDVDECTSTIATAIIEHGAAKIQDRIAWGTTVGERWAVSEGRKRRTAMARSHEAEVSTSRKADDDETRKPRRPKMRLPSDRDGVVKRARMVAERFAQIANDIEAGANLTVDDAAFVDDAFSNLFKDSAHHVWLDILRSIDHAARIAMRFDNRYNTVRAKAALENVAAVWPDLARRIDLESMVAAITGWRRQWLGDGGRKDLEPVRHVIKLATGTAPTSIELLKAWKQYPKLGKPSLAVKK